MLFVPLTRGYQAIIDDIDGDDVLQFNWCVLVPVDGRRVYAVRGGGQKLEYLHRRILGLIDSSIQADHRNGNGLDCRRMNLRRCTPAQNVRNTRLASDNTSGFKGVGRVDNRWRAYIFVNKRQLCLGRFDTAAEAGAAYDRAALEHFGEFALTNAALRARK